jgi:hypothetical protein
MSKNHGDRLRTALQVVAVVGLLALLSMVAHKALADLSTLAQRHSGSDFWAAVARQILRNLAGG